MEAGHGNEIWVDGVYVILPFCANRHNDRAWNLPLRIHPDKLQFDVWVSSICFVLWTMNFRDHTSVDLLYLDGNVDSRRHLRTLVHVIEVYEEDRKKLNDAYTSSPDLHVES
jgi:hypothetical protein